MVKHQGPGTKHGDHLCSPTLTWWTDLLTRYRILVHITTGTVAQKMHEPSAPPLIICYRLCKKPGGSVTAPTTSISTSSCALSMA